MKRKRQQKPEQCSNCHDYHKLANCPITFCTFCYEPDYKKDHKCNRAYVKSKLNSIGSYLRYVRNLLITKDYDALKAQLQEERPSYNICSPGWINDFVGRQYESPAIPTFINTLDFEQKMSTATWKVPFKISNLEADVNPITVDDIVQFVGPDEVMDVFDVHTQVTESMKMKTFGEKWNSSNRERILNSISLKISPANPFFHCPEFIKSISWQQKITTLPKCMQLKDVDYHHYCLMTMGGSFTNFHADYSGSSAYLYCYKGHKIFYLIEPTEKNMEEYSHWDREASTTPFILDSELRASIKQVVLQEGETLYLPGGYFHAVFTPEDSITFSGNFLHEHNIPIQLKVHSIDVEMAGKNYQMQEFELINSFIAYQIFFKDLKTIEVMPNADFKCLVPFIQEWIKNKLISDYEKKMKQTLKNMITFYHISQLQQ
uniref:JmjC domain-containing protein n=1 Tax=Panagrolaimus sp. ES5 TaxID=591445 RepID=A0AC34FGI8_9BILA